MVAVEPDPELGQPLDAAGGSGKPRVRQTALSDDRDREPAVQRAHEQFRWFGLGQRSAFIALRDAAAVSIQ
jgi:hypothetical protein